MRPSADASGLGLGPGLSFVASATGSGSGVTSVNVSVPGAVQNGDVIILGVVAYNSTISASGFTQVDAGQGNQTTVHKSATLIKTASNEGATWTVTFGTSTWPIVVAYVLRAATGTVANHAVRNDAASYVTSVPPPSSVAISKATDGVVYVYTGIDSLGSGTESATQPSSLNSWATGSNASLGGFVGIGFGTNVSAPGNTTVSPDGQDYMTFYLDLTAVGPFDPQAIFSQAVNRASSW